MLVTYCVISSYKLYFKWKCYNLKCGNLVLNDQLRPIIPLFHMDSHAVLSMKIIDVVGIDICYVSNFCIHSFVENDVLLLYLCIMFLVLVSLHCIDI